MLTFTKEFATSLLTEFKVRVTPLAFMHLLLAAKYPVWQVEHAAKLVQILQ